MYTLLWINLKIIVVNLLVFDMRDFFDIRPLKKPKSSPPSQSQLRGKRNNSPSRKDKKEKQIKKRKHDLINTLKKSIEEQVESQVRIILYLLKIFSLLIFSILY